MKSETTSGARMNARRVRNGRAAIRVVSGNKGRAKLYEENAVDAVADVLHAAAAAGFDVARVVRCAVMHAGEERGEDIEPGLCVTCATQCGEGGICPRCAKDERAHDDVRALCLAIKNIDGAWLENSAADPAVESEEARKLVEEIEARHAAEQAERAPKLKRGTCPKCGNERRVTRAGVMVKHVWSCPRSGMSPMTLDCDGAGLAPAAVRS